MAHLDGRTDIYALGCVLYEMLGGEPPFTGPSAQAVLARQISEAPRSLHVVRATVSPALQRVIETALAKVAADRYGTVGEFVAALERARRAPGWGTARRRRLAGAAAGLLAAAVGAWLLWPRAPYLDPLKIVVFPLTESNGGRAAGSGEDLAQVITSAMEQAEPLRVLFGWTWLTPEERRDVTLLTAAEARAITRAQGARWYLDGSLAQLGDSARVVLRLHDAGADSLLDQRSTAGLASASVLPRLALAGVARLLPRLLPAERGVDLSVLEVVAPAALSDWLLGERYFRRSRFDSAVALYQRAVARDSSFAYAAIKGAQAADWASDSALALVLIEVAMRTQGRLPVRYREYAEGFRSYFLGEADSAAFHLRRALALDSAWAGAWMTLGSVYSDLLPTDADAGATARAAFERAHRLDPEFSPVLAPLAEIAIRAGELTRAESLVAAFGRVHPDSATLERLRLMLVCARRGPGAVDWNRAARADPTAVLLAARNGAVGLRHPDCAEPGLRAVLALDSDDPDHANTRWGALLVLQGLLVGEGRMAEVRAVLDGEFSRGVSAVYRIWVVDAGLDVGTDSGAARAAAAVVGRWPLVQMPALFLWDLGLWAFRRGDRVRLDSIVAVLAARLPSGDPRDSAVRAGMAGRALLLRGDTAGAIAQLATVRAVGSAKELTWDFCPPAAEERLLLARLLLAQRQYQRAAEVAGVFDLPGPMAFMAHVPASLEIRAAAARGLGQAGAVAEYAARLARIGRAPKPDARKR